MSDSDTRARAAALAKALAQRDRRHARRLPFSIPLPDALEDGALAAALARKLGKISVDDPIELDLGTFKRGGSKLSHVIGLGNAVNDSQLSQLAA